MPVLETIPFSLILIITRSTAAMVMIPLLPHIAQVKVQFYSHEHRSYLPVPMGQYTLVVGSAYFIQAQNDTTHVSYVRNTDINPSLRAPKRDVPNTEFVLSIKQEEGAKADDRLYLSAQEDATDSYEIGHDLTKFGNPAEAKAAQVWAKAYGLKLCDVEKPLINNNAHFDLGLFAPKAGNYTLAVEAAPDNATLYLTKNNRVIWNLSLGAYVFDLTQGTTEGYGLRLVDAPRVETGFENADAEDQSVRKVMIDNIIYLITPDGKIYDIMGKRVE